MENAVQNLSNAFAHAMYEGFPLIEYVMNREMCSVKNKSKYYEGVEE